MIRLIFILFISFWVAQAPAQHTLPSERLFQSEIPIAYRAKVKAFVNSSLWTYPHLLSLSLHPSAAKTPYQQKALAFIQLLQGSTPVKGQREWHEQMISQLRALSENEKGDPSSLSQEIAAFLDSFSIWLFSEVDLRDAFAASFEKDTDLRSLKGSTIKPILQNAYKSIRSQSQYSGYASEGHLVDILMEGNMPLLLAYFENGQKKVPILRSGTMVIDKKLAVEVETSFKRYLEALGRRGKKHLYITLMRYGNYSDPKNKIEVARTQALVNLEKDIPSARIISLDKNSEFYQQKNAFQSLHRADAFKSQFLDQLLLEGPNSHYYWSKHLDKARWKQTLQAMVEEVHQRYFEGKTKLSPLERSSFIEICNLKITEAAIQQLDVDAVNIACRYGIDRGASLTGLFYYDHLLKHSSVSEANLKQLVAIVFGPGLFYHNRPIHDQRVEFLETAAERLQASQ